MYSVPKTSSWEHRFPGTFDQANSSQVSSPSGDDTGAQATTGSPGGVSDGAASQEPAVPPEDTKSPVAPDDTPHKARLPLAATTAPSRNDGYPEEIVLNQHSLEFMLLHVLRDPKLFRQAFDILLPEHFSKSSEVHFREIWLAARRHYQRYQRLITPELLRAKVLGRLGSGILKREMLLTEELVQMVHSETESFIKQIFDRSVNPDSELEPEAAIEVLKALLKDRTVEPTLRKAVSESGSTSIYNLNGLVDKAYCRLQEIESIGSGSSTMMDSTAFMNERFEQSWFIEDIFVENQVMVIGGAEKSMKTSIAMDMAISLGIGESAKFLNRFPVGRQTRVGFYSGEMGGADIQARCSRILQAKSRTPKECSVNWSFALPRVGESSGLQQLATDICEHSLKVVFVDPLYLALQSTDVEINHNDMYKVGPLLQALNRTCDDLGCTLVLVHHTRKSSGKQPLQLQDLAHSGVPQFARQWLLVNRTSPFDPEAGQSELALSVGGSSGHCGQYAVGISEGKVIGGNLTSRRWDVTVQSRSAQVSEKQKQQQEGAAGQLEKDWGKIRKYLHEHHLLDGETRKQIEVNTDLTRARVKKIVEAKVDSGALILTVRPKQAGNTMKDQTVYVLNPSFSCLVEEPGTPSTCVEFEETSVER